MPLLIVIFEMFANRVELKLGQVFYQVIVWAVYLFATYVGGVL
jgi:hypothetical protein